MSQGVREGYPHPPCFFAKSAELHENKRVDFFRSAKKCKRVRKSVKTKGMTQEMERKRLLVCEFDR